MKKSTIKWKIYLLKEAIIEGGMIIMAYHIWDEDKYSQYKECPYCGGSGKDNATLDATCYHCHGTGEIFKKEGDD